jgi:hypothetical protein
MGMAAVPRAALQGNDRQASAAAAPIDARLRPAQWTGDGDP